MALRTPEEVAWHYYKDDTPLSRSLRAILTEVIKRDREEVAEHMRPALEMLETEVSALAGAVHDLEQAVKA